MIMRLFTRQRKNIVNIEDVGLTPVITIDSVHHGLDYLVELVKQIRPSYHKNVEEAELKFKSLFYQLQHDKQLLYSLRKALLTQFNNSNIVPALTESGMVSSRGFIQEMATKLKQKILPPLLKPNDFLYVINHVFYNKYDYVWVAEIDRELWINFFNVLGIEVNVTHPAIVKQLNQALHIISQRTITLGLEKEIISNVPDLDYAHYSFVQLDRTVQAYLQEYESNAGMETLKEHVRNIVKILHECKQTIEIIAEKRKVNGTSLSQTYILFRLKQHLERIYLITDVLDHDDKFNTYRFLDYFIQVVHHEKKKNSLRDFLNANFSFIAYQITEHGSKKGIAYITVTRKEFYRLIVSAMGGGFIVSFTAVVKMLLGKVVLPPVWQGVAYSVNYAAGFQLMHETKTTLATKQPAYTAAAIAGSLDGKTNIGSPDLNALAITVARTIRSQLASFFGNLIVVFPLSFLLALLYHAITGEYLVQGQAAHQVMVNQHPYQSLSLLYACFTGFFLFASGIIAGWVDNGLNYGNVGERLRNHPVFRNTLAPRKLARLTRYVQKNLGAVAGNISLGFFLGMAGFFGTIFGAPFDVRHITISAANTGIAFYGGGHLESWRFLGTVVLGVLMIGLLNFLVSFFLAFFVAVKSRGVRLRDYPEFIGILGRYFIKYPGNFVFPPRTPRQPEDLLRPVK
jgi:site-specific recombinase